ncbi:CLUMA_CG020799, isoform A [Clunio marinus]|uniref:CLUMA_CG020799, isoform A n=1 Tax=Clunio marinus TaxID=568069 RepID=A0A1J1J622_9DIPT|nr:CLUMA_CG020799, isoform A [Clunio marinus]
MIVVKLHISKRVCHLRALLIHDEHHQTCTEAMNMMVQFPLAWKHQQDRRFEDNIFRRQNNQINSSDTKRIKENT